MSQIPDSSAIILLNMGGPDNLGDIRDYLYNIFADRSIIQLPGGSFFQKPFAKIISRLREKKVRHHYELIGGSSPQLKWTQSQAANLENILIKSDLHVKCYIGMRYSKPLIEMAVDTAYKDGYRTIIFIPLYPQYSTATTGSSFKEADRICRQYGDIKTSFINDFHDNARYIELLKKYIDRNIKDNQILLYSAHSLPRKFVDNGDPYFDQIRRTAELAAGNREYFVSFQSRSGPVEWVGPDTVEVVKRLLSERTEDLFVVPISFVSDHIETLYEIDIELKHTVGPENVGRIYRMPMFNDDPEFGAMLADLIINGVKEND